VSDQPVSEVAAAKAEGERAAEAMDRQPVPDSPETPPLEQLAEHIRQAHAATIPGAS
jgi:hypothetical protein